VNWHEPVAVSGAVTVRPARRVRTCRGISSAQFLAHGEVFHWPGPDALVVDVFAEPLERLLRDGAADGSLRDVPPTLTATVLFNTAGWGYIHLRAAHHWDSTTARDAVIDLVLGGLLTG
jgi:hypothetical protein